MVYYTSKHDEHCTCSSSSRAPPSPLKACAKSLFTHGHSSCDINLCDCSFLKMSNFCSSFGSRNCSRNPPGARSSCFEQQGPSKRPLHRLNPKSGYGSSTAGGKDSDERRSTISQWGRQQFYSHKDKSGSTRGPSLGGPADIGQEMVQVSQLRTVIRDLYPHQPNTVSKPT